MLCRIQGIEETIRAMNGYYTYFAFVAAFLAFVAVKYGWLAVELYQNFCGLVAGM